MITIWYETKKYITQDNLGFYLSLITTVNKIILKEFNFLFYLKKKVFIFLWSWYMGKTFDSKMLFYASFTKEIEHIYVVITL